MRLHQKLESLRAQLEAMIEMLSIDQRREWEARLRPE
jgi:hypothetical protein